MKRDKTFGIYVPSYKRYDCIKTDKVLNDCTYVVRESEEQLYRDAGVRKILAAPDQEIDSLPKIRQWIIDHTPEDIIVQIDDDIERFSYVNKVNMEEIPDPDIIDAELVRIGQILSDLNLGFASIRMQESVIKYNEEFRFSSTIGLVCWFNKASLKSRGGREAEPRSCTHNRTQKQMRGISGHPEVPFSFLRNITKVGRW